jgi:DNA-binding NtrC family response regulator
MSKTWDSTLTDSLAQTAAKPRWTARVVAIAGKPVNLQPVELAPVTPIGRAVESSGPTAGITLRDPRVSRLHASIEIVRGAAKIARHGEGKLLLNGVAGEGGALEDGAFVVLGQSAIVVRHRPPDQEELPAWGLLGDSPGIRAVRRVVRLVGPTASTVLILGESGTGKEVVARALHEASRRKGPMISVNASAIPATLAESHLFGHVTGAFTGATSAGTGVFRAAEGGTLFLDELAELPAELQPKLLRVLEERVAVPVGSTKGIPVDVRVISATNKDLLAEVDAGRFRGDLYARLSDFTLELPALRERREDILTLLARDLGDDAPPLSQELLVDLLARPYRFHVRELRKLATQLKVRGADAERLTLDMIDRPEGAPPTPPPAAPEEGAEAALGAVPTKEELEGMLARHRGVIELVAKETGRSRRQVHRWLEKYGIDLAPFRT